MNAIPFSATVLAFLLLINGTISAVFAIILWSYHHTRLTKYAAFVLLAIAFTTYWHMLEILAPREATKFVFHRLRYIVGDVLLAPYWFGFVLIYLQRERWLKPWLITGVLIFPLLTVGMVLTNNMHELVWVGETITAPPIQFIAAVAFGDWLWFHIIYSYLLTAVSIGLITKSLTRSSLAQRRQTFFFLLAMSIPIVGAFLNMLLRPTPINLVPLSISFSGVVLVWSFSRYQLLDLTPIARNVILENMHDLVIVVDTQSRIIDANPVVNQILLGEGETAVGQQMTALIPQWGEIMHTAQTEPIEKMMPLNGRFFDVSTVPIHTQQAEPIGCVVTLRDITAKRQLEEEFQQAQKMEAIGLLAGGVAHDLNNSLTVIRSYTDLLLHERTNLPAKPRRYAEAIRRSGEQATELIQQLLAFSRKQVWQSQTLDLNQAIAEVMAMVSRLIGETIEVVTTLEPTLSYIEADPAQLRQMIINLAINARDAMPGGGKLTLATKDVVLDEQATQISLPLGRYVALSITDTGIGMDEQTQARIFEPFFTTKETGQGTGLGLSTVYGVVSKSQGDIVIDSIVGFGTTFTIYFPAAIEPHQELRPAKHESKVEAWTTGSETILVVEDEESVLELVEEILEGQGYQLLTATNGLGAVSISNNFANHIDLLLTDVVMPGLNGRELAETLLFSRPTMKVVYMSGYTQDIISRNMALEGNIRLLDKPFTPDELIAMVRQALDAPH